MKNKKLKKEMKKIIFEVDTKPIDKALKKVDELVSKLNECIELIHQLTELTK